MRRAIEQLQEAVVYLDYLVEACDYEDLERCRSARSLVLQVIDELEGDDREARTQYVVEKQGKGLEAQMEAARIVRSFKNAKLTPDEIKAEAEKDCDLLFGTAAERDGSAWKDKIAASNRATKAAQRETKMGRTST